MVCRQTHSIPGEKRASPFLPLDQVPPDAIDAMGSSAIVHSPAENATDVNLGAIR